MVIVLLKMNKGEQQKRFELFMIVTTTEWKQNTKKKKMSIFIGNDYVSLNEFLEIFLF